MPSRRDGRIEPGQPLRSAISASAWNRAQDAADLVLGQRPSVTADGPVSIQAPWSRIKLRWGGLDPSRVLKPYSFVPLNAGMSFFPESTAEVWDGVPLYDATPGNTQFYGTFSRVGIAVPLEPISNNGIGWAAICGAVPVRIDVKNAHDTHAMPFVRQYTSSGTAVPTPHTPETEGEWRLQSFPFAGYKILSCVTETPGLTLPADDVWALVDLSSFWAQPLVLGRIEDNDVAVSGLDRTYLVRLYIANGAFPTGTTYYIYATTHMFQYGAIEDGTYVWMVNPYSMHMYNVPFMEPRWEIVGIEHEQWGISSEGVPTNTFLANQGTWLPKA